MQHLKNAVVGCIPLILVSLTWSAVAVRSGRSSGSLRKHRLAEWKGLSWGRSGAPGCPVDYDVPGEDGQPSPLHVASVNNFVDHVDPWWTEKRVEEVEGPTSFQSYKIQPSPVQGCGMFATMKIKKGEKIGVVWVRDDHWTAVVHFSPWYGRAINHCPGDKSTTSLVADPDGSVWSVAKRDIEPGEELTGDYNEAHYQFPKLVQGADPAWTC